MATQAGEFQLDRAPLECTHQHWFTEEGLLPIGPFDDDISATTAPLEVGQIVTQRRFEISVEGISDLFVQHWRDKWTAINELSSERLGKVLDFANAFLPPLSFELQPLTIGHWRAALKRMKVKAATDADGISRADLLALSDRHLQWLVDTFNALEASQISWPEQLLTGLVFTVAKIDFPHLPEQPTESGEASGQDSCSDGWLHTFQMIFMVTSRTMSLPCFGLHFKPGLRRDSVHAPTDMEPPQTCSSASTALKEIHTLHFRSVWAHQSS